MHLDPREGILPMCSIRAHRGRTLAGREAKMVHGAWTTPSSEIASHVVSLEVEWINPSAWLSESRRDEKLWTGYFRRTSSPAHKNAKENTRKRSPGPGSGRDIQCAGYMEIPRRTGVLGPRDLHLAVLRMNGAGPATSGANRGKRWCRTFSEAEAAAELKAFETSELRGHRGALGIAGARPLQVETGERISGQRCMRLFHSPRCVLRARRRHACAHGLLFTAAISIYYLRARSEAQIHGYYHTADRLVIIGLVWGWITRIRAWSRIARFQWRRGTPRVRRAHAHRGRTVEIPGAPLPRRCSAAVVNTAKIKGRTTGCGLSLIVEPFYIPDPFLPPPKPPSSRSTPPPRSPPPHRLPHPSNAASFASSSASPSASHATASNASDHSASSSASASADRRSPEAKTVSLRVYSAAFPGTHAHVELWAVRNVCPAPLRASGSQGAFSTPGWTRCSGGGCRGIWDTMGKARLNPCDSSSSPQVLRELSLFNSPTSKVLLGGPLPAWTSQCRLTSISFRARTLGTGMVVLPTLVLQPQSCVRLPSGNSSELFPCAKVLEPQDFVVVLFTRCLFDSLWLDSGLGYSESLPATEILEPLDYPYS
ncbi:hypothetical protein DFH09DRAFT_1071775 [Mycena vulgaris]|nr:hypothetical protein DFH09DRAFT_1071775 [Mycena vulgaris]